MIKTKDVVAKSLEKYPIYSTCPLCGREGEQRVFVIYEPDKVKDCLRARHSYYNHSSEPVSEILNGSDITKNRLYSYLSESGEDRVIRLVCSKCNTMYAPDPLQEHSIHMEQNWGLYFRINRPKEFPIRPHKFKMAAGIKCDFCKEEVEPPYYIIERKGKIEHYCDTSPNRCGPNAWHGEIELTKFMKKLQKEEERARRPGNSALGDGLNDASTYYYAATHGTHEFNYTHLTGCFYENASANAYIIYINKTICTEAQS